MGIFANGGEPPVPYSEAQPDRCERPRGPAFVVEGEDEPLRCGEDPRMPPASGRPQYERTVNRGYAGLKRRG